MYRVLYLQINLSLAVKEIVSQFQSCGPISHCSIVGDVCIRSSFLELWQIFEIRLICRRLRVNNLAAKWSISAAYQDPIKSQALVYCPPCRTYLAIVAVLQIGKRVCHWRSWIWKRIRWMAVSGHPYEVLQMWQSTVMNESCCTTCISLYNHLLLAQWCWRIPFALNVQWHIAQSIHPKSILSC